MTRKRASSTDLIASTDRFVKALLVRASEPKLVTSAASSSADVVPPGHEEGGEGVTPPAPPSIDDQVDVLNAVTKYLQVKHKIEPEDDNAAGGFFGAARNRIATTGGARSSRGNGSTTGGRAGRADATAGKAATNGAGTPSGIPFVPNARPAVALPDEPADAPNYRAGDDEASD